LLGEIDIFLMKTSLIRKIKEIIGNQVSGLIQPMSIEEFYERIEASEKAFADGNYISHEDLKKDFRFAQ